MVRQLRPHWMLMELNVDYQFHYVHPRSGQTMTPEFLALNPRHKIPVLKHGDLVITESAAIVQYLSETFESPNIYAPKDPARRAKVNEWSYFIMTELYAHSLYVIRRHVDFQADLRQGS